MCSMFKCTLKIIYLKFALFGTALVLGLVLALTSPLFLIDAFPVGYVSNLIKELSYFYNELEDYKLICSRG